MRECMIERIPMYMMICDACSKTLGNKVFEYDYEAKPMAEHSGWQEIGDRWYCPECIDRLFFYDIANGRYVRRSNDVSTK